MAINMPRRPGALPAAYGAATNMPFQPIPNITAGMFPRGTVRPPFPTVRPPRIDNGFGGTYDAHVQKIASVLPSAARNIYEQMSPNARTAFENWTRSYRPLAVPAMNDTFGRGVNMILESRTRPVGSRPGGGPRY